MVALLASYLFDAEPVHLFDLYLRPSDRTDQYWTSSYVPIPSKSGRSRRSFGELRSQRPPRQGRVTSSCT